MLVLQQFNIITKKKDRIDKTVEANENVTLWIFKE